VTVSVTEMSWEP